MFPYSLVSPVLVAILLVIWGIAAGFLVLRFIKGPTEYDRVICFEAFTVILIALFVILALLMNAPWFFDVVLVLSLVGFLSAVAIAKHLEKGDIRDD